MVEGTSRGKGLTTLFHRDWAVESVKLVFKNEKVMIFKSGM